MEKKKVLHFLLWILIIGEFQIWYFFFWILDEKIARVGVGVTTHGRWKPRWLFPHSLLGLGAATGSIQGDQALHLARKENGVCGGA